MRNRAPPRLGRPNLSHRCGSTLLCRLAVGVAATVACTAAASGERRDTVHPPAAPLNCPERVLSCRRDSNCTGCINATMPYIVAELSIFPQDAHERAFWEVLTTSPACAANATAAAAAIDALFFDWRCMVVLNIPDFGLYIQPVARCFGNLQCRACLTALYAAPHASGATLQTASCRQAPTVMMIGLAMFATSFPQCSLWKQQCARSNRCISCVDLFRNGNVEAATTHCSGNETDLWLMNQIVLFCVDNTPSTCEYWRLRCDSQPACQSCISAMQYGRDPDAVATAAQTQVCQRLKGRTHFDPVGTPVIQYLNHYFDHCSEVTRCGIATFWCSMNNQCAPCLNASNSLATTPFCEKQLNSTGWAVLEVCTGCPHIVFVINTVVIATAVVGGVSFVLCLAMIAAILGSRADQISIQSRILVALAAANAIYSSANMIPMNLYATGETDCGRNVLSFDTIRFGRSWWFLGKFSLAAYEVAIMCVSLRVLHRGAGSVSRFAEIAMQVGCLAVGLGAFVAFYVSCLRINDAGYNKATLGDAQLNHYVYTSFTDDLDDDLPSQQSAAEFADARGRYDDLTQRMLQVWLGLLAAAVLLWACLRYSFTRLLTEWRAVETEAHKSWDRDYWSDVDTDVRGRKQRLLDLVKEGYEEVARPLEPYVAVFVVFGVPAIVMATDFCQANSSTQTSLTSTAFASSSVAYGTCDVWCEFVLSFRSLAAVLVFLSWPEHRRTLFQPRALLRRLVTRSTGTRRRVVFAGADELRETLIIDDARSDRSVGGGGEEVIYDVASSGAVEGGGVANSAL